MTTDFNGLTDDQIAGLAAGGGIMAILAAYFLVVLVIGIVVWILTSIPLFTMAKNAGVTNAWLAWIPIGNMYVLNALGGDEFSLWGDKIHFNERINAFWLFLALSFGGGLLGAIPVIGALVALAASVLLICIQWRMIFDWMNAYNPGKENMGLSIVALIINIVFIVLLWMYKNRTPSYATYNTTATYNDPNQNGPMGGQF
jgi:hypothetical protein